MGATPFARAPTFVVVITSHVHARTVRVSTFTMSNPQDAAVETFTALLATKKATTSRAVPVRDSCWAFVAPSDCGLGLFARTKLICEQAVCQYFGPHLPLEVMHRGGSVLQLPGGCHGIDGNCENSPFETPRAPAVFANHSERPNARIEFWPALQPGPFELVGEVWIVASEEIAAGREIRIDYESGRGGRTQGSHSARIAPRHMLTQAM
jgi:hypothetical protein